MCSARLSSDALRWIDTFNGNVRMLANDLVKRLPSDPIVDRVRKRIDLAIGADPILILRLTGPCLTKYYEQITKEDVAFFIENEYDQEIRESVDKGRLDVALYLLPKIKEIARGFTDAEKKRYLSIAADMLDAYLEVETELRQR